MKLSFGLKGKRQKFATQFDDVDDDEEVAEAKKRKAERACVRAVRRCSSERNRPPRHRDCPDITRRYAR